MARKLMPQEVHSRDTFVEFVQAVVRQIRAEPHAIPNSTLGSFLDGVSGWVADMDGYFLNRDEEVPSEPSWQLFAQIVEAGLVYE